MATENPQISSPQLVYKVNSVLLARIPQLIEICWLMVIVLVPVAFLGRNFGEWSSVIGSFELPKITILRTLVAFMAALWLLEWGLRTGEAWTPRALGFRWFTGLPRRGLKTLKARLRNEPVHCLKLMVVFYGGTVLLSTVLSASLGASLWGDVPGQDAYSAYTVLAYLVLFWVLAHRLRSPSQFFRILSAVALSGTLVAVYGVLQHYGFDYFDLREPVNSRGVSSTMGNAIFAGSFLLITAPITLALSGICLNVSWGKRLFWVFLPLWTAVLSAQTLGLAFTFARGPWIGGILALAVLVGLTALYARWRPLGNIGVVLIASVLVTVLAAAVFPYSPKSAEVEHGTLPPTSERLIERVGSVGSAGGGTGLSGRLDIWRNSWDVISGPGWYEAETLRFSSFRPLVGFGPELFRPTYLMDSPPGWRRLPQETAHAHNFFVHQGVELGLLGVLSSAGLFIAVFVVGAFQLRFWNKNSSLVWKLTLLALLAAIAGWLLAQMVGVARVSEITIIWVLLAIFVAIPTVARAGIRDSLTQQKTVNEPRVSVPVSGPGTDTLKVGFKWLLVGCVIAGIGLLTFTKTINYARGAAEADKAASAFRDGRLEAASDGIDRAIRLAPDNSTYYQQRVQLSSVLRSGDLVPALPCRTASNVFPLECSVQEAYALNVDWTERRPLEYKAWLARAESANELAQINGDTELEGRAVGYYRRAADLLPNSWPIVNLLAQVYISKGSLDLAMAEVEQSLALTAGYKESTYALLLRGNIFLAQGDVERGIGSFNESIRVHPGHTEAYFERALARVGMGFASQALDDFKQTIKLDPSFYRAYVGKGIMLHQLGMTEEAIATYNQAIKLNPEDTAAFNGRGVAYIESDRAKLSIADFTAAIGIDPMFAVSYNNRGFAYMELSRLGEAMDDLNQAILLDQEFARAYFNRAVLNTLLSQDAKASMDAARAIELGNDPTALKRSIEEAKSKR